MKTTFFSLILLAGALVPSAMAQSSSPSPVVVELFASQNCGACPRAHKTLKKVNSERDDMLVLTWSVDYWDYLGEADPMAMEDSKDRQNAYVERFGLRGPYTPQTVYNGVEQCPGNKRRSVDKALKSVGALMSTPATLKLSGDQIALSGTTDGVCDIWLVEYLADETNTTDMLNPVTRVKAVGQWIGGEVMLDMPECSEGCALVVQEAGFGPILAAMQLSR